MHEIDLTVARKLVAIPRKPGIYKIQHLPTGRVYIGSAVDIRRRLRQHLACLRRGGHPNQYLQRAWSKYGEDQFVFGVVELVASKEGLLDAEQKHIDANRSSDRRHGYNLNPKADSGLGRKHTPEAIAKLRARNFSPETRAKISAAQRNMSPETRAKMSEAQRGKKLSDEHKAKLSAFMRQRAPYRHTEESKAKISASKRNISQETREKIAAAQRGKVASPELRAKRSMNQRGRRASEETRAKLKESFRNRSPELRARMVEGIREAYRRKRELAQKESQQSTLGFVESEGCVHRKDDNLSSNFDVEMDQC